MGYAEHILAQGREPPGELEPVPSVDPAAAGRGGTSGERRRQDDQEAGASDGSGGGSAWTLSARGKSLAPSEGHRLGSCSW
jgi:hypothetical protein